MPHIAALYRYPVKGCTPEACDTLTVLPDGRVAGDRVLAFRYADSPAADDQWSKKHECVVLVNTPGLARLRVRYDHERLRLRVAADDGLLVDAGLDAEGRARIAAALQRYVLTLPENPLAAHPGRVPLRLVGDGRTPRFQDNEGGHTTLHGRASLAAFARHMGLQALDEVRFRSNVAVEGLAPWEELGWFGRRVRIGTVEFDVVKKKTRCLATHANPGTGERDLAVMPALMSAYPGEERPTFAVGLRTAGAGGKIRMGDEVRLCA